MVPTVVLAAHDEKGQDLADVTVTFDGAPFATKLDGKPLQVDGGEHLLHFERDGSQAVDEKVILRAGEKTRVVSVLMKSTSAPEGGDAVKPVEKEEPPAQQPESVMSARHVTSAVFLLGALGTLGTAVYFTTQSSSESQTAMMDRGNQPQNACSGANGSSANCQSLNSAVQSQHSDANVGTGLFVAAGALAVGSVMTWLLVPHPKSSAAAPSSTSASVLPLPGGVALSLSGSFQ
jgi:hypothetical protein